MTLQRIILTGCMMVLGLVGVSVTMAFEVPKIDGWIVDQADVLTYEQEQIIQYIIDETFSGSESTEIGILTIASLSGETIEDVAQQTFDTWGIGKKDRNNGLLIVLAIQDKKRRIEVGYGLEGNIPDAKAYEIGKDFLVPDLKQGDYYHALISAVGALSYYASSDYEPYRSPVDEVVSSGDEFDPRDSFPYGGFHTFEYVVTPLFMVLGLIVIIIELWLGWRHWLFLIVVVPFGGLLVSFWWYGVRSYVLGIGAWLVGLYAFFKFLAWQLRDGDATTGSGGGGSSSSSSYRSSSSSSTSSYRSSSSSSSSSGSSSRSYSGGSSGGGGASGSR